MFGQSLLFGYVRLGFPEWQNTVTDYKVPLVNYQLSVSRPGIYFTSLFYLGLGMGAYWIGKNIITRGFKGFIRYLKQWTNGSKYLKSDSVKDETGR